MKKVAAPDSPIRTRRELGRFRWFCPPPHDFATLKEDKACNPNPSRVSQAQALRRSGSVAPPLQIGRLLIG